MKLYVVTEGEVDRSLIEAVMDFAKLDLPVNVFGSGSRSNAPSLARSVKIDRRQPIALAVDADSVNERLIAETKDSLNFYMRMAGPPVPVKIVLFEPEIEAAVLAIPAAARLLLGRDLDPVEKATLRSTPKDVLRENGVSQEALIEKSAELAPHLTEAQGFRDLIEFARSLVQPMAQAA